MSQQQATNIQISSVRCKKCRLYHSLDENGLCEFCRREAATVPESDGVILALAILLAALITIGITLLARR
jgi:uncharacterized paraquat-inducible protein A